MIVLHLISTLRSINFGIWNAALFGSTYLQQKHGVKTIAWITDTQSETVNIPNVSIRYIGPKPTISIINEAIEADGLNTDNTVVVSHGCWLQPSRQGLKLKRRGFQFLYTPHGMLETWSLQQNALKKRIYFALIEKWVAMGADEVRAVSAIEATNLEKLLHRETHTIYNGTHMPAFTEKQGHVLTFLFMGRLHQKKGILPLVKAWSKTYKDRSDRKLVIAGPDEGELVKLKEYLSNNIVYSGPVYGEEKKQLLRSAHYFMLPSFSEGFPSSVVEAMAYGAIPMISAGCNLPEVFENQIGYHIEPDEGSISSALNQVGSTPFDHSLSARNHDFARRNYSEEKIGHDLYTLFEKMLKKL